MKPLSELQVGERGVVRQLEGDSTVKRRLMAMGFVAGTEVEPIQVAPMGDPVVFEVKGYNLSLRKAEAALVRVEPIEETPLADAPVGARLRVTHVHGGWGMRRRLSGMGVRRGAEVTRLAVSDHGPVLVRVAGVEQRVGRHMAERVFVQETE